MNWIENVTLIASVATTIGVFFAWYQIRRSSDLHRTQFEDSLAKEYRELMQRIPVSALLGETLNEEEFRKAKPYLFHYINLTNDQIFLRSKDRISVETWNDWRGGIETNMKLPAIKKMWEEIEEKSENFVELRTLLNLEGHRSDPKYWSDHEITMVQK